SGFLGHRARARLRGRQRPRSFHSFHSCRGANMKRVFVWILAFPFLGISAAAQDKESNELSKEDPAHNELRALRDAMKEAFNKKDIDALLKHLHPDVIVTWQNGEVSKGPGAVREYYKRMLVGNNSVLVDVQADPEVTDLSLLFGEPTMTA